MTVHVNQQAIGGLQDGSDEDNAYLHPDDIPALSLVGGDKVLVKPGSGTYIQTTPFGGKGNGSPDNPVVWDFGFNEWSGGKVINDIAGGEWHESASGTNEYYFTASGGADPDLRTLVSTGPDVYQDPSCGTVNGHYFETQAEEALYQMGNTFGGTNHSIDLGSLPDGYMGFGDNDSLGFRTVYVRLDDLSHATADIIISKLVTIFDTNFTNQKISKAIFSYCDEAIEPRSAAASKWTLDRCILKYTGWQGVNISQDNAVDMLSCVGFFAGHRFFLIGANADAAAVNVYNCVSIKSHLFGWISRWYNNTITMKNNIGYKLSAGVLDTESDVGGTPTIDEDNNVWYPDWEGGATSMNYPSDTNTRWATTGANSFPPSADTGISSIAANEAAGAIEPVFKDFPTDLDAVTNSDLINLVITNAEYIASGNEWWTGANPQGLDDEPYSNNECSMGSNQSKEVDFHPTKL